MMDENSAGCASEGVDLGALQEAYVLLTEPAGMTEALRKRVDAAQRMVALSLPAIIAELRAARTLPAPTISQDVPAPAAVTAEMVARIIAPVTWKNRDLYVEVMMSESGCAKQTINDLADGQVRDSMNKARAILAALSAATPLQSDLAADNARLLEALDAAHYYIDASDFELEEAGMTRGGALLLARILRDRAALQGADNHD